MLEEIYKNHVVQAKNMDELFAKFHKIDKEEKYSNGNTANNDLKEQSNEGDIL